MDINEHTVGQLQADAAQAYQHAISLTPAPVPSVQRAWRAYQAQADAVRRSLSTIPGERAPQWKALADVAREAIEHFSRFASLTAAERVREIEAEQNQARSGGHSQQVHHAPTNAPTPPPAANVIAALTQRGISLAVEGKKLVARPASKLSADDRQMLTMHKAGIIDMLTADAVAF